MNHIKKKHSKKLIWSVLLAFLLVAVASAGVWYYFSNPPKAAQTSGQPPVKPDANKEQANPDSIKIPDDVDPSSIKSYTVITENEAFKIRELDGKYLITLYAIINRPEQSEQYYDQLRQYKQQALEYLENQSVDTANTSIQYEPAEANDL